ncbi:MAG: hypothetical protein KJ601_04420 [Nanoarchaeota archaeon]|nr:hypothetical protein [Nanoarchaeota archaeon]MBU1704816.1 hypothetical protein [Nanoarchaeota archaeon]
MDTHQQILDFIRIKGPTVPTLVAKHISKDSLMTSAYLSELSSKGKVIVSKIRLGQSPLYYLPGQESRLQDFSSKLNEKDLQAYNILKDRKIVKDSEIEPLYRVAMRNLRDFAMPLNVSYDGKTEIFWKWYLLSNQEAEKMIKQIVDPVAEKTEEVQNKLEGAEKPLEKIEEPLDELKPEKVREEINPVKEDKKEQIQNKLEELPKKIPAKPETLQKPIETKKENKPKPVDLDFLKEVEDYFQANKIEVLEKELIRKTEIDFKIRIPSSVGSLTYYCKAKSKLKLNDGDLSSAFIQAQSKKLPCLFLSKGDLTKRAAEMLDKEFSGMHVKKI